MADSASPVASNVRWTVVALLFAATTVNYIDRQVLSILAPTLTRELGWRETDYAAIVSWFSVAYGVGLLGMGRLLDRIGCGADSPAPSVSGAWLRWVTRWSARSRGSA